MKVARKYIPLAVRVQVAHRQLLERGLWKPWHIEIMAGSAEPQSHRLAYALSLLFYGAETHLDHDPALCNRPWNNRTKDYEPRANDPAHLVYRTKVDHDIKTRIRGIGARHSDLGQRRKNKALARNRSKAKRVKRKIPARPFGKGRKMGDRR